MCGENQKPCCFKAIFWAAAVISAVVAIVLFVVRAENARIEREREEKDCDIKECGC